MDARVPYCVCPGLLVLKAVRVLCLFCLFLRCTMQRKTQILWPTPRQWVCSVLAPILRNLNFASSSSQSCNFSSSPGALRQRFPMTMVFATRRISGVNSVFQPYSFEIGINLSYTPCASFVGKSHCRSRPAVEFVGRCC